LFLQFSFVFRFHNIRNSVMFIVAFLTAFAWCHAASLPLEDVDEMKARLLADLTASFRRGHDEGRLVDFEDALSPMFQSLPKQTNGTLGHMMARYALHRLFISRHGWSIEGLAPVDLEREATPMTNLSQWMPDYLVDTIENLLGTNGVTLRELAAVAATFEDLIHREASGRLEEVYDLMSLSTSGVLHETDSFDVIKAYMTMYTSGGNTTVRSKTDLLKKNGGLNRHTKQWLREVQVRVAEAESLCNASTGDCGRLDFNAATRVVEEIGEQYRSFNEHECEDLSSTLLQSESEPGKVKLSDFYSAGLHGSWNFTETPEYLRALGALDESDSEGRVLVPNYVSSRPNCLATSAIYVVCCRNQCEKFMTKLENSVQAPVGNPQQILQLLDVASSEWSLKLNAIAKNHNGQIPLHGHSFALWLHGVFPRSCPRPHMAGVSSAIVSDDLVLETGEPVGDSATVLCGPAGCSGKKDSIKAHSTFRFVSLIALLGCALLVAFSASRGVLFDADGLLCLSQRTKEPKQKAAQMPLVRAVLLSVSLIAVVFILEALAISIASWNGGALEVMLSLLALGGLVTVAVGVGKNISFKQSNQLDECRITGANCV